jgi:hypothetical protein
MRKFADVRLEFGGKGYTILANRLLPLIARLEGIVTFVELIQIQARGGVPQAKLAMAYGEALRYAGADVSDDEVYYTMFPGDEEYKSGAVAAAVTGIMALMLPPEHMKKMATAAGNVSSPATTSGELSRKRTKRR